MGLFSRLRPERRAWRRFHDRVRGCTHAGLVLPLRYHVVEGGIIVELGRCERCGAPVAR